MKPIDTEYKGYRFRSRLEARWAVFFDALKIQFEYELEGYCLSGGTKYLPDFLIPEFETYFEIKPRSSERDEEAERKASAFARESGSAVCVVYGDPYDYTTYTFYMTKESKNEPACFEDYGIVQCPRCEFIYFVGSGPSVYGIGQGADHCCFSFDDTPDIKAAASAARKARFEH